MIEEIVRCTECEKTEEAFGHGWKECTNCGGHIAHEGEPCCQGCEPCIECKKYVSHICETCYACDSCCKCATIGDEE